MLFPLSVTEDVTEWVFGCDRTFTAGNTKHFDLTGGSICNIPMNKTLIYDGEDPCEEEITDLSGTDFECHCAFDGCNDYYFFMHRLLPLKQGTKKLNKETTTLKQTQ